MNRAERPPPSAPQEWYGTVLRASGLVAASPALTTEPKRLTWLASGWVFPPFDMLSHLERGAWSFRHEADLGVPVGWIPRRRRLRDLCRLGAARQPFRARPSPRHRTVHTDLASGFRVHGRRESVQSMTHQTRFALPPSPERSYRRWNPGCRPLLPYRTDCAASSVPASTLRPVDFLYPRPGIRINTSVELGRCKVRVILAAEHRGAETTLHWHIDDQACDIAAVRSKLIG